MPSVPAKIEEKAEEAGGMEVLHLLKSVSPPLFLSPSPSLSQSARSASTFLFSSLLPACPKSPFDRLLVEGFDAEQIWQQIDLQSRPLIANLRREIKRFETNPSEITKIFGGETLENKKQAKKEGFVERNEREEGNEKEDEENESFDEENGGIDEEDEDEEDDGEEEEGHGGRGGIEDGFLKLEELEEFLEKEEAREYEPSKEKHRNWDANDEEDGDNDEAEEDEEEGDMYAMEDIGEDGSKGADNSERIRYEDFYGSKNKKGSKKAKSFDGLDEMISDDDKDFDNKQDKGALSTHEKQLQKIHSTIEKMEKENLETKHWTMQGEVTANKRPKNSALEVDLDFERNVRPPPVITEEVAASLEELIKKRIIEGHFDDVQRAPSLPSKAPKELKELDENKSQKGLAEIYEEEFMQKTGLTSAPLSFSDELKKEASLLFKKLCVKLDALSHFYFTPKPVIEDMSIQANVPALAMEEIAPLAVSDAAMLAPEEVFAGKGEIKEDAELTQEERKRRRAKKKRKFKAETDKRMATKKARENAVLNHSSGKDES